MSGGTFESARSNLFSNLVDGLFHLFSSWSLFPRPAKEPGNSLGQGEVPLG